MSVFYADLQQPQHQSANVLFCNACSRMFQIDTSYILNSCAQQPLLTGPFAPTTTSTSGSASSSTSVAVRRAAALAALASGGLQVAADVKRVFEPLQPARFVPSTMKEAASSSSDNIATGSASQPHLFQLHEQLPAHLTEHAQWSGRFLAPRAVKPLHIDPHLLLVPTVNGTDPQSATREDAENTITKDSLMTLPLATLPSVKSGGTYEGITWPREGGTRPRGRVAEYPPGISVAKDKLIRTAWSIFGAVSQGAQQDMPLCPRCWRQAIQSAQHEVDALAYDAAAFDGIHRRLLHPTTTEQQNPETTSPRGVGGEDYKDGLSMLYNAPEGMRLGAVLLEEGLEAERRYEAIEAEWRQLQQEELALAAEEAALEKVEADVHAAMVHLQLNDKWLRSDAKLVHDVTLKRLTAEDQRVATLTTLTELYAIDTTAAVPTINGLRIGYFPPNSSTSTQGSSGASSLVVPIATMELNGACCYLATLLQTLAQRNRLTLQRCTLKPKPFESIIETVLPGKKEVTEYNFHIVERLFSWKTFGAACGVYVDGVRQVTEFLTRALQSRLQSNNGSDADTNMNSNLPDGWTLRVPHAMTVAEGTATVGGFSVKHGTATDEVWTKGMRCLLGNLNWCLVAQDVLERSQKESINQRRASQFIPSN